MAKTVVTSLYKDILGLNPLYRLHRRAKNLYLFWKGRHHFVGALQKHSTMLRIMIIIFFCLLRMFFFSGLVTTKWKVMPKRMGWAWVSLTQGSSHPTTIYFSVSMSLCRTCYCNERFNSFLPFPISLTVSHLEVMKNRTGLPPCPLPTANSYELGKKTSSVMVGCRRASIRNILREQSLSLPSTGSIPGSHLSSLV